ncbi:MAG TPA: phage portal protein, partial [Candidatus Limnocylindrales bacterium]|nr:phage portal protein [Candidatus Limnocylindrales bacterium]
IWQANQMDAQSQKAHREAIIKGDCPVIVAPAQSAGGLPVIRVLKPEEVVIAYDDDPLRRAVAMRRWNTPDGRQLATLYFPDRIEKYERAEARDKWGQREVPDEEWPALHDLGVVPVIPILNDPDLDNCGASEIATVTSKQDILNRLWAHIIQASETAAFRQKWATGVEIPEDPETHKPIEKFQAAVGRIWSTVAPDAKFGDFEQTEMAGMIQALGEAIQEIAAETRTPYHYFLQHSGQPPSGESLKSAETGLVAKAKRRQRDMGEGWEEVERLAFRAMGDERRASIVDAETIWRDPETRTEAEHVDALVKLGTLNVPEEQLWADAGYSPQQIERFLEMRAREPQVPLVQQSVPKVPATDTAPADVAA